MARCLLLSGSLCNLGGRRYGASIGTRRMSRPVFLFESVPPTRREDRCPAMPRPSARYLLDHEFVSEGSLDLELSCSGGERTNTSWPSRPSVRPASRRPRLASLPSTTPAAPSNLPVDPAIWTKQPKVRLKADCDADDWPRQICNLPPIASRPRLCQIAVVSLGCPRDAVPGMLRSAVVGDFSSAGRGTASPPQRCGI